MPNLSACDTRMYNRVADIDTVYPTGTFYSGTVSTSTNSIFVRPSSTIVVTTVASASNVNATVYTATSSTSMSGTFYYANRIPTGSNVTFITVTPTSQVYTPPKIDYKKELRQRNYARKALYKSVQLFENFFGYNQIKLFLSGESILVQGKKFNYKLSRNKHTSLIEHTAKPTSICIPYNLEICNKQGLVLCSGCTVFRDTPIIDQLTAMLLHIMDNEENVLLNMNLSNFKPAFYDDEESIDYLSVLKKRNYRKTNSSVFRDTPVIGELVNTSHRPNHA